MNSSFRFAVWNDMHFKYCIETTDQAIYQKTLERARWVKEFCQGLHGGKKADLIVSAGDLVDSSDKRAVEYFDREMLDKLSIPYMPCMGNHEIIRKHSNAPTEAAPYDESRRNYAFTFRGFGFIVVDTSEGQNGDSSLCAFRNNFVEKAYEQLKGLPIFVISHMPLVFPREESVFRKSFGFKNIIVADPALLKVIEKHASATLAVISGHIHLTGACQKMGIHHIIPSGTSDYPHDFVTFDVYADHIAVEMHQPPKELLEPTRDIHGKPRHALDYADVKHESHAQYISGNADERRFTISLDGKTFARIEESDAEARITLVGT